MRRRVGICALPLLAACGGDGDLPLAHQRPELPELAACDVREAECTDRIVRFIQVLYGLSLPERLVVTVHEEAPTPEARARGWWDAFDWSGHLLHADAPQDGGADGGSEAEDDESLFEGPVPKLVGTVERRRDLSELRLSLDEDERSREGPGADRGRLAALVRGVASVLREESDPRGALDSWTPFFIHRSARRALRAGIGALLLLQLELHLRGRPVWELEAERRIPALDDIIDSAIDPAWTPGYSPTREFEAAVGLRYLLWRWPPSGNWRDFERSLGDLSTITVHELLTDGGAPGVPLRLPVLQGEDAEGFELLGVEDLNPWQLRHRLFGVTGQDVVEELGGALQSHVGVLRARTDTGPPTLLFEDLTVWAEEVAANRFADIVRGLSAPAEADGWSVRIEVEEATVRWVQAPEGVDPAPFLDHLARARPATP